METDKLIDKLADTLTLNQAAALLAKIHEKKSAVGKGKRFGMYPIEDWAAFERMKKLEASFWVAEEIEFSDDRNDFNELTPEEQHPLLMAFGFFAVGDGSIASMLAYRMILIAESFEQQAFYTLQLDNERVHGETYGKMIYTLIQNPSKRNEIFNAVENVKSIKKMNEFIEHSFTHPHGKKELYVALASAEYLFFTPLFCIIFWYRAYKKGKLGRVVFSNELIAKDEAAHCQNGCDNYRALPSSEKYTDDEIHKFIQQVTELIFEFSDEVLNTINLEELTPNNVKQYVKYVADDELERLGHPKLYNVHNPFEWMDFTNLVPKSNFYEKPVGEYARFNAKESVGKARDLCSDGNTVQKTTVYSKVKKMKF
jgi:ribonucleotide reductase beta subunit family protein with ferritin-like domain